MSWQHYLYSQLGQKKDIAGEQKGQQADDTVERIVAMAKVLFGLHMVSSGDELSRYIDAGSVSYGRYGN